MATLHHNTCQESGLIDKSQFSHGVSLYSSKKLGLADQKTVLIC